VPSGGEVRADYCTIRRIARALKLKDAWVLREVDAPQRIECVGLLVTPEPAILELDVQIASRRMLVTFVELGFPRDVVSVVALAGVAPAAGVKMS
jgi:hypothetical protein